MKIVWGVEGAKRWDGIQTQTSCKDGSDLYRPIVEGEEPGSQTSQTDNNGYSSGDEQSGDGEYSDDEDYVNVVKREEPSTLQVWKTEPVQEKDFNAKGKEERAKYRKDSSTGLWMIAVTEETCEANDGFVCRVRVGVTE